MTCRVPASWQTAAAAAERRDPLHRLRQSRDHARRRHHRLQPQAGLARRRHRRDEQHDRVQRARSRQVLPVGSAVLELVDLRQYRRHAVLDDVPHQPVQQSPESVVRQVPRLLRHLHWFGVELPSGRGQFRLPRRLGPVLERFDPVVADQSDCTWPVGVTADSTTCFCWVVAPGTPFGVYQELSTVGGGEVVSSDSY